MRKSVAIVVVLSLLLVGCGTNPTPEAKPYQSYGPLNEGTYKSKNVCYETSGWSIFLGIVGIEMFFIPTIYFFGYNLYNPVRLKRGPDDQCTADG